MVKSELVALLKSKSTWNAVTVIEHLNNVAFTAKYIPTHLQVGDIFFHSGLDHPVMMVTDRLGVIISTTETEFNLCEVKSRFIGKYITGTIIQVNPESARKAFICVHDDRLQVHRIKKLLKKQLQSFAETL